MHTLRLSKPLHTLLLLPYFLLIIAGLVVPSDGGHSILSIKSIVFILTVATVSFYLYSNQKVNLSQYRVICFLLISLAFLIAWMFITFVNDDRQTESAWDQFKICWITFSVIAISEYLVSEKLVSLRALLKTIIYANCAYSTVKVGLIVLHLFGVINIISIAKAIGIRFMTMEILETLPRMQTSIDIATPYLLFFFLQREKFDFRTPRFFGTFYLIVSAFSIFLSFSRFLIFVGIFSIFLHGMTLPFRKIARAVPYIITALIVGVYLIGPSNIQTMVERRIFSSANSASDRDRVHQIHDLTNEYSKYPLLGKGLGGYVSRNIRDSEILHSYEVQWAAFLMQFGLIGIGLLIIAICAVSIKILSRPWTRTKLALFVLFLTWLSSGFTNPFLVSLTSGIMYTLFLLMGDMLSEHNKHEPAYE